MPHAPPDAETIRRAVERVLSQEEYHLRPRPTGDGRTSVFFESLKRRFWDPLADWWSGISGQFAWADEVLYGVVLGVLLLTGLQVFRLRRRRVQLTAISTTAPVIDRPDEIAQQAQAAAERGEHIRAARLLLLSSKLRLETAERRINRPGTTNRELLRRYRQSRLSQPLQQLVETVDRGWYGGRDCTRLDYLDCLAAHDEIAAAAGGARLPNAAPGHGGN